MNKYSHKSLSMIFKTDKNQELRQQKQSLIETNENKIFKIKKLIDNL
jgi:hypothetical protein